MNCATCQTPVFNNPLCGYCEYQAELDQSMWSEDTLIHSEVLEQENYVQTKLFRATTLFLVVTTLFNVLIFA